MPDDAAMQIPTPRLAGARPHPRSATSLTDRRTFLRRVATLALMSGGAVLLNACGDSADTAGVEPTGGATPAAGGQSETALDELIFLSIVPPESLTFTPELLGVSRGYFTEVGLNVRMERTRGSAQAVQGILSELALISRVGDIEVMLAVGERGAEELVNLGTLYKDSVIRIVSSPNNPVQTAADLADKLIGIPSEGGTSELTIDLIGLSAGLEDLSKQVVGLTAGTYDLVDAGRIDCYAVSLDTAVLLEQTRDAVVYAPGDAIFAGGQCYMGNRIPLEDEEDDTAQDIVGRFLDAVSRSVDEIIADQENDFENVIASLREQYSFESVMDDEIATASMSQYVESWTLDGPENVLQTTEERWQGVYEELIEAGSLESGLNPSDWYTNDYVS